MNAIKPIRALLGVTQAELAIPLGVTQGNVSFYEQGQTVPPQVAGKLIDFARSRGVALTFDHVYGAAELPACSPEALPNGCDVAAPKRKDKTAAPEHSDAADSQPEACAVERRRGSDRRRDRPGAAGGEGRTERREVGRAA